ncbi:hypothetical protein MIR68_006736 [Amoeboaphelidium protococcarum]|nr:hypothetical protein MIR68_006736 [Amoeboaphelidium protococcarum]
MLKVFKGISELSGLPISSSKRVSDIGGEAEMTEENALVILVPDLRVSGRSLPQSSSRITNARQLYMMAQRKGQLLSVEQSCRKFLDSIARKLSLYYNFDYTLPGPTISDLIKAKKGIEVFEDAPDDDDDNNVYWSHSRAQSEYECYDYGGTRSIMRDGDPLIPTKLPDIFTANEWEILSKLDRIAAQRFIDGRIPRLHTKSYVVIPHSEFTPESVASLKNICVKAELAADPDGFLVYDQDGQME